MIYKRFFIRIIIRVIFLLATCIWLSEALRSPRNIYTLIVILLLLGLQIYSLIFSINSLNRDIVNFLYSIQEIGSGIKPRINLRDSSFKELSRAINKVSDILQRSKFETEKQLNYFEFVVDNIPAGIIIIDQFNLIKRINKAALSILKYEDTNELVQLKNKCPELFAEIENLKVGEKRTFKIKIDNEIAYLLLGVSGFLSENEDLRIISFQNVVHELEENELLSWQKLTRILTHEIMNSITPIASLTEATKRCLTVDGKPKTIDNLENASIRDAVLNLNLVEERSQGIRNFISNYKRVSQVPKLNLGKVSLNDLVKNVGQLSAGLCNEQGISLVIKEQSNMKAFEMDRSLIEQVLLNLVNNSIEALAGVSGKILRISVYYKNERPILEVADNGRGIPDEIMENIFMPFYTSKSGGMGIGLSLSRQIMRLHKGTITAVSVPGKETTFSLVF
ncbi:MAG TPA: ATP-binding protein [Bacteroidales bacterium]|nr:ATP-binding protein [Bacteroidales bacterium]